MRIFVMAIVVCALTLAADAVTASARHNPNPALQVTFAGTWKVSHSDGSGASFQDVSGRWRFTWTVRLHDFRDFPAKGRTAPRYYSDTSASGSGEATFKDYGGATCHAQIRAPALRGLFGLELVQRRRDRITVQAATPFGGGLGSIGARFLASPDTCLVSAGIIFQSGSATSDWTPRFAEIPQPRGGTLTENAWNQNVHAESAVFEVNALAPEKTYPVSFSYKAQDGSADNVTATDESWSGTVRIAVATSHR